MPDDTPRETTTPEPVDALILGSGQAGNPLASALAAKGRRVVLVESRLVGGTCVNSGCTPTKTMIAGARVAELARHAARFGVHTGPVSVRMGEVRHRKREVVDVWRAGSEKRLASDSHIELVHGTARFAGTRIVEVALNGSNETRTLTAPHIFINTGLHSMIPPGLGLEHVPFLTNETVMELDKVPRHLIILGGGYIAVEFAQMFRRFGAQVTIVNRDSQLLPREDPDVAGCLAQIFEEDGITLLHNAQALAAGATPEGISLVVRTEGESEQTLRGSHLLIAAGRAPNTEALNLPATGLQPDEHGFIPVDDRLETPVPGIYALGDVKGGPAFTHISYDDYRIVAANLLEGGHRTTAGRPVPYTIFTDPELGRIGLSEAEARAQGRTVRVARMPASSVARAYETGDDRGLMKIVVDADTEQILGAAILLAEGGEVAAIVQTAMMARLPYTALRDAVWAHPTWAESLNNIFFQWQD